MSPKASSNHGVHNSTSCAILELKDKIPCNLLVCTDCTAIVALQLETVGVNSPPRLTPEPASVAQHSARSEPTDCILLFLTL